MNLEKKIFQNTLTLLAGNVFKNITGFAAVVYLARVLLPETFGKLNFAIAFVAYFILIVNMGLPLYGTREVARAKDKIGDYLGNIWSMRLYLAVFGFLALYATTSLIDKPSETKHLILLYGLEMIPSALLIDWVFLAVERMGHISYGRIISSISYLVLVLLFATGPDRLLLIPAFKIFASILLSGYLIVVFVREFGMPKLRSAPMACREILRGSLPIGLSLFMAQIFYNMDTVMLGFLRSDREIGYYNSAYMVIMFLIVSIGSYHNAIYPLLSDYFMTSRRSLKQSLENTTRLMVILAIPLAMGGSLLAGQLMNLLFGPEYAEGKIAFQILIWAVLIIYLNTGYSQGVLACNLEKWYFRGTAIPAVVNVLCNFVLIPRMGIKGAAMATVFAEATGFIIMYNALKSVVQVPFWPYLLKPTIAALIMSLFLLGGLQLLHLNFFLLLIGGMMVYSVSLFLIKGISEEDIRLPYNRLRGREEG